MIARHRMAVSAPHAQLSLAKACLDGDLWAIWPDMTA